MAPRRANVRGLADWLGVDMADDTPCIWPGCSEAPYSATEVHLCRPHFLKVGASFMAEMRHSRVANPDYYGHERDEYLERRQAALKAQEQVYYVRVGDRIKIGFTNNVRTRMGALRVPITALLATEPGGRELERVRHKEFAGLRDGRREDFFPHDRLTRHIDLVRETFGPPKITTYPKVR